MHCRRFVDPGLSRREMLLRCSSGFGALAMASLLREPAFGTSLVESPDARAGRSPRRGRRIIAAKARSVIFLYMDGGPSQVDTFDPKPRLDREHGQPIKVKTHPTQFNNVGNVLRCPWKFRRYGESGIPVSDLFPHVGRCVDRPGDRPLDGLELLRAHERQLLPAHRQRAPGASEPRRLGDLRTGQRMPGPARLRGPERRPDPARRHRLLQQRVPAGVLPGLGLPAGGRRRSPTSSEPSRPRPTSGGSSTCSGRSTGACWAGWATTTAWRPRSPTTSWPSGCRPRSPSWSRSTASPQATRRLYGLDDPYPPTRIYARECLIARRLVERGVRFVELLCPAVGGDRWDQHGDLKQGHENNARAVDRPIAALLQDLKGRGLLDSTLVVWAGEFGRTPMAQGSDGRDHNPYGFTVWLAGGGIKGGTIHGATDDYGYHAIENKVEIHDLHATMLHLLGVDHKRLTYRFGGRDMRLTDVHGEVITPILA